MSIKAYDFADPYDTVDTYDGDGVAVRPRLGAGDPEDDWFGERIHESQAERIRRELLEALAAKRARRRRQEQTVLLLLGAEL